MLVLVMKDLIDTRAWPALRAGFGIFFLFQIGIIVFFYFVVMSECRQGCVYFKYWIFCMMFVFLYYDKYGEFGLLLK